MMLDRHICNTEIYQEETQQKRPLILNECHKTYWAPYKDSLCQLNSHSAQL